MLCALEDDVDVNQNIEATLAAYQSKDTCYVYHPNSTLCTDVVGIFLALTFVRRSGS